MANCPICCEKFNRSVLAPITCDSDNCQYTACKSCVRTYLLSTTSNPHCMQCRKGWTPQFLLTQLNRSYLATDYKQHRKELLVDRELSKMPESMPAVQCQVDINQAFVKTQQLEEAMQQHRDAIVRLDTQQSNTFVNIRRLKRRLADMEAGVAIVEEEPVTELTELTEVTEAVTGAAAAGAAAVTEDPRRKFTMACPSNTCRGYLSSQYKCALCLHFTCHHCLELLGLQKTDPQHLCNPANVLSAELIRKETKPCPTCSARIFKISGCDQMWCTGCHKAFSWLTGKVDHGIVHNPHFYQYRQQVGTGAAEVVGCQDHVSIRQVYTRVESRLRQGPSSPNKTTETITIINTLHRALVHVTHIDLVALRLKMQRAHNSLPLRVSYLLQTLTKEELADQIFRNDQAYQKLSEIANLLELFTVVGREMFHRLVGHTGPLPAFNELVNTELEKMQVLRRYCNAQLATISTTYNQTVPQILPTFLLTTHKFTLKELQAQESALQESALQESQAQESQAQESALQESALPLPGADQTIIIV